MEYAVKRYLESKGFLVIRSAGSKSPVDLVAVARQSDVEVMVLLVQCKHTRLSQKSRARLQAVLMKYNGLGYIKTVVLSKEWRWEI